ncbi:iron chelate uptake ABC transporter family permease subunit [Ochrobactrum sp. Marseille-Q0166]|uniref:FecCD family ABC transporter permease n=1 Tax=Ochrobactrum sp. Marseille-Q0166 TaxID=2761105 RepID=UPI001655B970|nr:iron chelate uptake ABC transporter family permease subunit [Ochrobactrum sp. Marseille-Q0166]MBC8719093.1 iron chelate uptake ABC transporter family permease subunit [Ochrobactrum sp. Marseille-Q0166]
MSNLHKSVIRLGSISIQWRARTLIVCACLICALFLFAILHIGTGTMAFSPQEIFKSLLGDAANPTAERIIMRVRLPRLVTAIFVGASLGMAGSIFQSISRNALGSPDIIGFTTGAATGAIVQIILFNAGPFETALAAVLSGLGTAIIVFVLALKGRTTGGYRLILIGLGVGAVLSGVNTVLLVAGDLDQAASAQLWLAGSLNTRTWAHAIPAVVGFFITVPIVVTYAQRISLIEMGDDAARQLGVSVETTRLAMVLVAVTLTSVATAATGPIAFIALAAPQLVRRLTHAPGVPLIASALLGAVLLVGADLFAQHFPLNIKMPIGLTTGLLGGIYLLWILSTRK